MPYNFVRAIVEIEYPVFNIKKGAEEACKKVEKFIYKQFYDRIKQRIYSLAMLRALDHPYAKRHYPLGVPLTANFLDLRGKHGVPLGIINKQSGKLLRALKSSYSATEKDGNVMVWIDKNAVKYAKFVFFGTRKMIARPLHKAIVLKYNQDIIKEFFKTFVREFVERKQTKKYVRFL